MILKSLKFRKNRRNTYDLSNFYNKSFGKITNSSEPTFGSPVTIAMPVEILATTPISKPDCWAAVRDTFGAAGTPVGFAQCEGTCKVDPIVDPWRKKK